MQRNDSFMECLGGLHVLNLEGNLALDKSREILHKKRSKLFYIFKFLFKKSFFSQMKTNEISLKLFRQVWRFAQTIKTKDSEEVGTKTERERERGDIINLFSCTVSS